jgi:hypothetical protein
MKGRKGAWKRLLVILIGAAPAYAADQAVTGKITTWEGNGSGLMVIGVGKPNYLAFRGKSTTSIEKFPQHIYVRIPEGVIVRLPKPPESGKSRRKRDKPDPDDKDWKLPGRPGAISDLKEGQFVQVKVKVKGKQKKSKSLEAEVVIILGEGPPAVKTDER